MDTYEAATITEDALRNEYHAEVKQRMTGGLRLHHISSVHAQQRRIGVDGTHYLTLCLADARGNEFNITVFPQDETQAMNVTIGVDAQERDNA